MYYILYMYVRMCVCISYDCLPIISRQALTDWSLSWEHIIFLHAGAELLNWIFRNLMF